MQRYKNFIALTNKSSKKARKKARSIVFNICYSCYSVTVRLELMLKMSKKNFYYIIYIIYI